MLRCLWVEVSANATALERAPQENAKRNGGLKERHLRHHNTGPAHNISRIAMELLLG